MEESEKSIEQEKVIAVYSQDGDLLSYCTRKRAARLVWRQKAKWKEQDQIELIVTREDRKLIRRRVRERDNMTCIYCDAKLTFETITYDHLTPKSRGGNENEDNIGCACQECNRDKANLTYEEYFMRLAAQITIYILPLTRHYNREVAATLKGGEKDGKRHKGNDSRRSERTS